jgi:hypothetical protein
MIDGVVGNKPIPASVRQDIIERTDGIPVRGGNDQVRAGSGSEEGVQPTAASVPHTSLAVPASLRASLMARLDPPRPRQGGRADRGGYRARVFPCSLSAVARKQEVDLGSALDRLVHAGLLFRQGVPPHVTYLFKHAPYRMRLMERCCGSHDASHAPRCRTLEGRFVDIAETQPELLGATAARQG